MFTFTCVCFLNFNSEGVGFQFSPISMIKLERGSKLAITRCSNSIQQPCPFKNKTLDSAIAYSTTIYIEKKQKKLRTVPQILQGLFTWKSSWTRRRLRVSAQFTCLMLSIMGMLKKPNFQQIIINVSTNTHFSSSAFNVM